MLHNLNQNIVKIFSLIFILSIAICNLNSEVFKVNQNESLVNILLFTSLDLYNNKYTEDNISPLSAEKVTALDESEIFIIDRWSVGKYRKSYSNIATSLTLGVLGTTAYFSAYDEPYSWDNLIVLSEIIVTQAAIANWTKTFTRRSRPYVYHPLTKIETKTQIDARLSFYSFHTSTAFSAAVYNHYYQRNSFNTNQFSIWINYGLASSVAAMSVISGKHYLTDVLIGATAGSLISYFICNLRGNKSINFNLKDNLLNLTLNY